MDTSRRNFLGTAALGAGGLVLLTNASSAGTPTTVDDKGTAGQGGFGRDVQKLQPGANVAYHDAKDICEMPASTRSLDGSKPKVTSGGWAKETTVHSLPIETGIAAVHMFLDPGASRELH